MMDELLLLGEILRIREMYVMYELCKVGQKPVAAFRPGRCSLWEKTT